MKIIMNFKALAFATLAIRGSGVFAHGTDSGLRGGTDSVQQEMEESSAMRNLAAQSERTPFTQNIDEEDNGGTGEGDWPFFHFSNRPAFSKMSFDLSGGGDINLRKLRVDPSTKGTFVEFSDVRPDENYQFSVTGVELPTDTEYVLYQQKNVRGCFDSPPQPEVSGKVPVMQAFAMTFVSGDFNIQHIRAQVDTLAGTNRPIIRVCYADFNSDDAYNLAVRYALVDEDLVFGFKEYSNTNTDGGLDSSVVVERPINTVGIINGFDLEYLSGDRDTDEILVEVSQDGRLHVNLKDQTNNDAYRWKVNVAFIGAEEGH